MATWTDTTAIKTEVTNGKPGTGTGGFGDHVADNLQFLYDRANQVGINSVQGLHDDFAADNLDADTAGVAAVPCAWDYTATTASLETPVLDGTPDHWAHFGNTAAKTSAIAASKYRMRFDLDRDHTIFFECLHKSDPADNTQVWLIGFQDASLATSVNTCVTTQDNVICFRQDATANKYDAIVNKAAAGALVVANSIGDGTTGWNKLRIEITFSGATKKVEFFLNGSSVGSTTDTSKIPVVKMRPLIGFSGGGGGRHNYIDYLDCDWGVRPLST